MTSGQLFRGRCRTTLISKLIYLFLVLLYTLSSVVSSHLGTISRIPEIDDSTRNKEVEKGLIQTMLTEPLNPASIEIRLCAGQISLLQAKVHNLQEEIDCSELDLNTDYY